MPIWLECSINILWASTVDQAILTPLNREAATGAVQRVSSGRCASTISVANVQSLLRTEGAQGLMVTVSYDGQGNKTFMLTPSMVSDGKAVALPNAQGFLISSPCPMSCGSAPSSDYVVDLTDQ